MYAKVTTGFPQVMAMGYYFHREVELLYPTALVHARFFSPSFRSNQICYVPKQSRVEIRKKQRHIFPKVYLTRRRAVIFLQLEKCFQ